MTIGVKSGETAGNTKTGKFPQKHRLRAPKTSDARNDFSIFKYSLRCGAFSEPQIKRFRLIALCRMFCASDPSDRKNNIPKLPYRLFLSSHVVGNIFCYVRHQARRDFSFSHIFSLNISAGLHWQRFHISSCSIFKANGMKIGRGAVGKVGLFDSIKFDEFGEIEFRICECSCCIVFSKCRRNH